MDEYKKEKETWRFTTDMVPHYRLSDDVRKMCLNTNVYWMTSKQCQTLSETKDSGIHHC